MRSDVDTIKERLDIAEVVSGYIKLEPAGKSFKACCPFHNEKTPSFFVSPARQGYHCFGCGAKGDIFSFVESMEGVDFREALKILADKAGIELSRFQGDSKDEKEKVFRILEAATLFFENNLREKKEAKDYLEFRGLTRETMEVWRLGFAPDEWRKLYTYLKEEGYEDKLMLDAGLIKDKGERAKEPYDVFRGRIIFPLFDTNGRVIAFSGRALSKETEPKYLNSPDTMLFTKSEVLYGLDKAREHIRKKNYAVLVEGQIDLVLSHQVGVENTVASSGTAFTELHLERLKKISQRIILAFDGDEAGEKAVERSLELGLLLGIEVKVALMPKGEDPAEVIKEDPNKWKYILRNSVIGIEYLLDKIEKKEKDPRKFGQLVEKKILPLVKLFPSAIERSHLVSLISKRTGIKEDALLEDLKRAKTPEASRALRREEKEVEEHSPKNQKPKKELVEERLIEIKDWRQELKDDESGKLLLEREEIELLESLSNLVLRERLDTLRQELAKVEAKRDEKLVSEVTLEIQKVISELGALEKKKK